MMRNLPVPVTEEDIDQMFDYADKDKDGKINYRLQFSIFLKSAPNLLFLLVNSRQWLIHK